MIKPFVDMMSVSPEGGHALFDSGGNSATAASSQSTATESSSKAVAGKQIASNTSHKVPPLVTYSDNMVFFLLTILETSQIMTTVIVCRCGFTCAFKTVNYGWWCSSVVEHRSLTGELSLAFYIGKPSTVGQPTTPTQPSVLSGSINE